MIMLFILFASDYPKEFTEYDKNLKAIWPKFNLIENEKMVFDLSFMGFNVGEMVTKIKKSGENFNITSISSSYKKYKFLYTLQNDMDLEVTKSFNLISFTEKQDNGERVYKNEIKYKYPKFTKHFESVEDGEKEVDDEDGDIPRFVQNFLSTTYLLRYMPLKTGDEFIIPMHSRKGIWPMKVFVASREKVEANDKDYQVVKVLVNFNDDEDFSTKSNDNVIWYSDDQERKLVKMKTKMKIGSLSMELRDYTVDE